MSNELNGIVELALAEDVGGGDLTTAAVVSPGSLARARIEQREAGVLFGLEMAREVFATIDSSLDFAASAQEGVWRDPVAVATVEGSAPAILTGERVALNLLGRLSGVATMTARYVRAIEGTGARILDTRKTTPGIRQLEKAAVVAGGGVSHRAGLFDAILVKENHSMLAGGVGEAARRAVAARGGADFVEVEIEGLEDLAPVMEAGVDRILLDNMSPAEMREAVERAKGSGVLLEASGGVSLESVREIAETGVDYVSVGAITHSAPALDLSLLLERYTL